ncbi:MAG: insulinase family protein, partial [Albidovulum sp.]|nr:insulinase family protein [Albidovulum sp.]
PYGIPVNGWRHEFENLTENDARDFFRRHYAPNNAILLVAGNAFPDEVRKLAELNFGAIEPTPGIKPRIRPSEPLHRAERRLEFKDERVRRPYLVRHYLAPERDPGDQKSAAALVVLKELLGGRNENSILIQELVTDRLVAMHVSAFYGGTAYDDTSFGIFVMPNSGVDLMEAESALDDALAKFLNDGPDHGHLQMVKNRIRVNWNYEGQDIEAQAMKYGRALTAGLSIDDVHEWPSIVEQLTIDDIVEVANRVLKTENSVTGWMMTKEGE